MAARVRASALPFLCAPLLLASAAAVAAGSDDPGVTAATPPPAAAPAPCASAPAYALLDFWLGDWDVLWQGRKVGTNRISRVLAGCAVHEQWRDARGGEGWSLFYREPVSGEWRQVWVTDQGPIKEKRLVAGAPEGAVRFQGEVARPGGVLVLDRTTLTPASDGSVRQTIEQSTDGGASWTVGFDAIYVRRPAG